MLTALGTKVVIEKQQQEDKTHTGIILTSTQDKRPRGRVISIGSMVEEKLPGLKLDDLVIVEWSQTQAVETQGQTYYIADCQSIYARETL